MRYETSVFLLAVAGVSTASPALLSREVPQEHSHNTFVDLVRTSLNLNNPKAIQDPIFGLLGNAAAVAGAGQVTNPDCLQQETADQAFTNAKAAGDSVGMAGALVFRAIERNTGSVGLASVICNETATNPEIAALTQHQDPASSGAAATNKAITLALAKQLAAIGVDPLLALESGTFAPGTIGDTTGAGKTCDTADDEPGCIFSQKLIVLDATEAEISSAVSGIKQTFTGTGVISATDIDVGTLATATGAADAAATTSSTSTTTTDAACSVETTAAAATSSCSVITTTIAASATLSTVVSTSTTAASTAASTGTATTGTNVQAFTGTLGGAPPPVVSSAGDRPFSVNGDTFVNSGAALQRSCSVQHNACANAANSGTLSGGVGQCETQEEDCNAANAVTKRATLDFGSCGSPTILFEDGLDGRTSASFIAEDQTDYNHGSALNIAVIAGFICQRLGSPCNAAADTIASCTSASAAAVATTQDQSAADAFNNALGVGSGDSAAAATTTAAATATATATAKSVVMTVTACN